MYRTKLLLTIFLSLIFSFGYSQCGPLATAYNQNNGQDGIMFDIVAITSVEITNFDINCGGTTHDFEIYYKAGTHVGFENNAGAWTLLGSANGVTGPVNVATPIPIFFSVTLCPGDVAAFYVTSTGAGSIDYTNGTGVGNVLAADANIQILEGTGKDYPFNTSFTPRSPNITVHYNCLASCTGCDPSWNTTTACSTDGPINLDALITGDVGGTWSGTGVTGNTFDPSVGTQTITYTSPNSCDLAQAITVTTTAVASWTPPTGLCTSSGVVDLNTLITGTTGGTWTGTGVTGSSFDPSVGTQSITYSAGTAPCDDAVTQTITVTPQADASWTPPTGLCTAASPIDLSSTITGTTGGTWSGTGITGSTFDPSVGTQSITYTVGTAPCDDAITQTINVALTPDASWTIPTGLCVGDAPIDLSTFITGSPGGTWSGTGVTGTMFDPSGGSQSVTYSIGTAPCDDAVTQTINVASVLDASWTPPIDICVDSGPFDLNTLITGDTGGSWSGTGVTGNSFDVSVGTQSLTYTVGTGGCQATSTQTFTVNNPPDASWTTLTLCSSSAPVNMSGQITGLTGGTWSGTGMSGNVFDPFFGTQNVTYTVSANGCTSSVSQDITVVAPVVSTTVTGVSCFGEADGTASATVTGGTGNYTYSWDSSPAQTTANATGLPAGTYTVTVTDVDAGCTVQETVTIIEPSEILLTMTAQNVCYPDLGSASVAATGGVGGYSYSWSPVASTTELATGIDSTMATVIVTDANGCTATDSIFVTVWNLPNIEVTSDTTMHYGDETPLLATGGVSYTWSPATDLSCSDCADPIADPIQDSYYCVTGQDVNGCVNTACMTLFVEIVCGDIFVPSAFSPNNDGDNDVLCVYSDCMKSMNFTIYNRWGEKVYTTSSMNICWDGTWNGKMLNSAVFVYVLEGYLINGEPVNQKGNISLIR
ncbi:gliding motility-associated C-terminal domain-containing protein [Paracrocinitomix mangrovi]|uniref:T9SS type B sorting domain-containing protein n=1 Tax=Paracrocinitomix mangrovi TaxID=2862509 RepID=UPI001C8D9CAA|nr:gliding motility-associated C-terminal domain-containing protein [Paracrocinitomix mangrovi]UKN03390.1 gliding motility-associated C-terminal domain-containing protein [Paracrocinitomix mangrovi]